MKHFNDTRPYKVTPNDLTPKYGAYSTVLARLYRLEKSNWIVIHRDGKRVRGIDVLAVA